MSWSITIHNLSDYTDEALSVDGVMLTDEHPEYDHDMHLALEMAKRAGLQSAVLTGMRAPNPYADDEVVDISIRGMVKAANFTEAMKGIVSHGPAANSAAVLHQQASEFLKLHPCPGHNFQPIDNIGCKECGDTQWVCPNCGVHLLHGLLHVTPVA